MEHTNKESSTQKLASNVEREMFIKEPFCGFNPLSETDANGHVQRLELFLDAMVAMTDEVSIDPANHVSQATYVIEECSELIKELMKLDRNKGSTRATIEEAVDVFAATSVLLYQYGVDEVTVRAMMCAKYERALERWETTREL